MFFQEIIFLPRLRKIVMVDFLESVCGPVAQLGERKHGMFQVAGSIPVRSTSFEPLPGILKCYNQRGFRHDLEWENQESG